MLAATPPVAELSLAALGKCLSHTQEQREADFRSGDLVVDLLPQRKRVLAIAGPQQLLDRAQG